MKIEIYQQEGVLHYTSEKIKLSIDPESFQDAYSALTFLSTAEIPERKPRAPRAQRVAPKQMNPKAKPASDAKQREAPKQAFVPITFDDVVNAVSAGHQTHAALCQHFAGERATTPDAVAKSLKIVLGRLASRGILRVTDDGVYTVATKAKSA
jgi:hypothetical protein